MNKYEVTKIGDGKESRFYDLKNKDGKNFATIEFCGWKFYKYKVSFAFDAVENNLNKSRNFRYLAEAKKYIAEALAA